MKYNEVTAPKEVGSVVLPAESGQEDKVKHLSETWGATIIRDSDGTILSPELVELGLEIYSTLCLVRADQDYPRAHPDKLPQMYLISERFTATEETLTINPMTDTFDEKFQPYTEDVHKYWQIYDRTTGEPVDTNNWDYSTETGLVTISNAKKYHEYTVSFLANQTWDSTSMYNHRTNNWTGDKIIAIDPQNKETRAHITNYYKKWLTENPNTNVVRFTTFFVHFVIQNDAGGNQKFFDWTGYNEAVTTELLDEFEAKYGYRLLAEDFVDQGYFNNTNRVPSKKYRDWMEFTQDWVIEYAKELVALAHKAGREAAMFQGDHWIGTEPYSDKFKEIEMDISIGACGDAAGVRRVADSGGDKMKEVRLYPYLFPDTFNHEGGNPEGYGREVWRRTRRGLLRRPIDRMGYGGYLSLAVQFQGFVDAVTEFCDEFRAIKHHTKMTMPYTMGVRVAILSCWGKLRSWYGTSDTGSFGGGVQGSNIQECLAGLPLDVKFIDFEEVKNGALDNFDVVINDGDANSAWSGGDKWLDAEIIERVRAFVAEGGGFIGVRQPSAIDHHGKFYQLSDVMGVDEEIGNNHNKRKDWGGVAESHFITDDATATFKIGTALSRVYPINPKTEIVARAENGAHTHIATSNYHDGRSVYFARVPYNPENARVLLRAILWAAKKEDALKTWSCENPYVDIAAYPEAGTFAIANFSDDEQTTNFCDGEGEVNVVTLSGNEIKWFKI